MNYATFDYFDGACRRHGIPAPVISAVFKDLTSKYAEKHRKYHNLEHIDRMLGFSESLGALDDEVKLAIWFHDAIYDPSGSHNERLSADYFLSQFGGYLWRQFTSEVERLIMATDHRRERRGTNREDLIIDMDLSILGAEPEEYRKYVEQIREEYSFVSDAKFQEARVRLLESFLGRTIFVTERFSELEEAARSNIQAEITSYQLQEASS